MTKHLLSTLGLALLLSAAAQAQTTPPRGGAGATTPRTPAGNRTAGTTANPVDPTSNTGSQVSGATGTSTGGSSAGTSTSRSSDPAPAGAVTPETPTGNHTAGTTAYPVDPTSKKSPNPTYRSGSDKKVMKKKAKSGM